ncbi:MAG: c-type cytochrome [Beijerinckiaceae bacterium]
MGARTALAVFLIVFPGLATPPYAQTPVEAGERLFEDNCAPCHGERISNPNNLFDLKALGKDDRARFDRSVREGKGQMPAWEGTFSDEEFDGIWAYIRSIAD